MFSSKGFLNLRVIALLLALIAGIKPIDSLFFYGRNVETLNKSIKHIPNASLTMNWDTISNATS